MTDPHYLSPHCATGHCKWCTSRRAAERQRSVAEYVASQNLPAFDHWERKIGAHDEHPSPVYDRHVEESVAHGATILLKRDVRNTQHRRRDTWRDK